MTDRWHQFDVMHCFFSLLFSLSVVLSISGIRWSIQTSAFVIIHRSLSLCCSTQIKSNEWQRLTFDVKTTEENDDLLSAATRQTRTESEIFLLLMKKNVSCHHHVNFRTIFLSLQQEEEGEKKTEINRSRQRISFLGNRTVERSFALDHGLPKHRLFVEFLLARPRSGSIGEEKKLFTKLSDQRNEFVNCPSKTTPGRWHRQFCRSSRSTPSE